LFVAVLTDTHLGGAVEALFERIGTTLGTQVCLSDSLNLIPSQHSKVRNSTVHKIIKKPCPVAGFFKREGSKHMLPFTKISNNKGQGLVEFGLILPIILFLLIFIIEGGLLLGTYIRVLNVSRETARQIAVHGDEVAVLNQIVTHFGNENTFNITQEDIQITYSNSETREEATRGDTATVLVEIPYSPITNFLGLVIPNTISATNVMMIEN
jgi:uncharacterized protein (UPF0333 family)